jgi:predicted Fe-Mo cluster-binding NifX family protein
MYIAVTADGKDLESPVAEVFETCRYLLIVDMDSMETEAIENTFGKPEEDLSKRILDRDCEAVITGQISPEAFEIVAGACVTRYLGIGHTAGNALDLMQRYALDLIKSADGSDSCEDHDHEGSCDGHHHDEDEE